MNGVGLQQNDIVDTICYSQNLFHLCIKVPLTKVSSGTTKGVLNKYSELGLIARQNYLEILFRIKITICGLYRKLI